MSGAITEITVSLAIDSERFLQYYRGRARQVVARSLDGRTVRFPADILQRFLTHKGVHGVFIIRYDANNRFLGIERRGTA